MKLTLVLFLHSAIYTDYQTLHDSHTCQNAFIEHYGIVPTSARTPLTIVQDLDDKYEALLRLQGHRTFALENNALDLIFVNDGRYRYTISSNILNEVKSLI